MTHKYAFLFSIFMHILIASIVGLKYPCGGVLKEELIKCFKSASDIPNRIFHLYAIDCQLTGIMGIGKCQVNGS